MPHYAYSKMADIRDRQSPVISVDEEVGNGSFGIVYNVRSPDTGRSYVMKRNLVEHRTHNLFSVREAEVLVTYRHPYIVRMEAVIIESEHIHLRCPVLPLDKSSSLKNDRMHFMLEKADMDLHSVIHGQQQHLPSKPEGAQCCVKYMYQMLLALEHLNLAGIMHRDIKPPNFLLFHGDICKMCDLGMTKLHLPRCPNTPGVSSSIYRAPELLLERPDYSFPADIWSMGCTFYEMVTGKQLVKSVTEDTDEIMEHVLAILDVPLTPNQVAAIRGNDTRKINADLSIGTRRRNSIALRMSSHREMMEKFRKVRPWNDLCDLITRMLSFDPRHRPTATQCLDHPFFRSDRYMIERVRHDNPPVPFQEGKVRYVPCREREVVADIIADIFNRAMDGELTWYSHRILFHAMDTYNRYIQSPRDVAHDTYTLCLYFMTCVYLSIKYFTSVHPAVEWEEVFPSEYHGPKAMEMSMNFEIELLVHIFDYRFYVTTLYEIAVGEQGGMDGHGTQVRDLVVILAYNNSLGGMTYRDIYRAYKAYYTNFLGDSHSDAKYAQSLKTLDLGRGISEWSTAPRHESGARVVTGQMTK